MGEFLYVIVVVGLNLDKTAVCLSLISGYGAAQTVFACSLKLSMSKRITLKKGKNLVRAAVINGPGMSDMCARFYNEDGTIFKNYTITNN